jgi:hypothetical protein
MTKERINAIEREISNGREIHPAVVRELLNEIARLKTPAAIWEAYHALAPNVLGPWEEEKDRSVRRNKKGCVVCKAYHPSQFCNEFGGFFIKRDAYGYEIASSISIPYQADIELHKRDIDTMARERGYILIDAEVVP